MMIILSRCLFMVSFESTLHLLKNMGSVSDHKSHGSLSLLEQFNGSLVVFSFNRNPVDSKELVSASQTSMAFSQTCE